MSGIGDLLAGHESKRYLSLSNNYSRLRRMRWDSMRLTGEGGASGQPPPVLFERSAVSRTFDTPGFRGMTFHEIHAKTIISRVPEASRVPFRWTINPYRGCSHACSYCIAGDTPVLMADGRHKPVADLRAGDRVYGTVRAGRRRRYVPTEVLAHWQTHKPAYRVTLADGTTLIASGDHRFRTVRGWRYVAGAEDGRDRRARLTPGSTLLGVGAFAEQPKESADYRRGYLGGMIRGGGQPGQCSCSGEALDRTRRFLQAEGVGPTELGFAEWPVPPSADWQLGFLAAIFDAEGSCSRGVLRISSTDPVMLRRTESCLRARGFRIVPEPGQRPGGLQTIRLLGGLRERLRFLHATDPAITRKRQIDGVAVKGQLRLDVTSIEPLGLEVPMYDITTGTGDFVANGVISHNCFARNTHTYLDFDAGRDFDSQIVVKVNAAALVRRELAAPRWRGEHIAMGTNVDCYQRAEGRYELMPGIIRALTQAANPFSILTKGTLILRDIDLLAEAAEVTDVGLNVSAGFVDKELSRLIESGAPAPERRLAVCAALNERGLACGVLMGPIVPFLSDSPAQLERSVRQIAAAGATHVSPIVLHLRTGAREWFLRWLREQHPELMRPYAELYGRGAYAPAAYQRRIADQVAELARRHGAGRATPRAARRVGAGGSTASAGAGPGAGDGPGDVQLTLL